MSNRPSLDDYIDVAERLMDFTARWPLGTLQMAPTSIEYHLDGSIARVEYDMTKNVLEVDGRTFIVYRAAAYRQDDDKRPGMGTAWEPFPGATPYTKNSELMNAETAAWGRAILACGLPAKRGLASKQEVRNRVAEQEVENAPQQPTKRPQAVRKPIAKPAPQPAATEPQNGSQAPDSPLAPDELVKELRDLHKQSGISNGRMVEIIGEASSGGTRKLVDLNTDQALAVKLKLRRIMAATDGIVGEDD